MHSRIRFFLSFGAITVFAVIAMATYGGLLPSGSTNTQIGVSNCKPKPEVSGTLKVYMYLHREDGRPAANAKVKLYLTHQIINDTTSCATTTNEELYNLTMGSDGRYLFDVLGYTHKNESDLWRAEIIYLKTDSFDTKRTTSAAIYDDGEIIFNMTMIEPLQ